MISGVVYLLRIFKMFHGLTNNPVFINLFASKNLLFPVIIINKCVREMFAT